MSARKLPSLSALRAFEAAARHRSAKAAAQELSVTPTAISRQLRQLEDYLGVALFVRKPRQLVLTGAGQTLLTASSEAFDTLADTVARLRHDPGHQTVTLSTIPAVAGRFLLPWVCLLRDRHPQLNLNLRISHDLVALDGVAATHGRSSASAGASEGYAWVTVATFATSLRSVVATTHS